MQPADSSHRWLLEAAMDATRDPKERLDSWRRFETIEWLDAYRRRGLEWKYIPCEWHRFVAGMLDDRR